MVSIWERRPRGRACPFRVTCRTLRVNEDWDCAWQTVFTTDKSATILSKDVLNLRIMNSPFVSGICAKAPPSLRRYGFLGREMDLGLKCELIVHPIRLPAS